MEDNSFLGIVGDVGTFFVSLFGLLFNFLTTFVKSIIFGLKFFFDFFTLIPNFIMNEFIPELPPFFSTTIYGLLGFMLFVVVAKVYFALKG